MSPQLSNTPSPTPPSPSASQPRRTVLQWVGMTPDGAPAFGVDLSTLGVQRAFAAMESVDFGKGDFSILDYAHALERPAGAFSTAAVASPFKEMTAYERDVLIQIKGYEIERRDVFKTALAEHGVADLTPNFSGVDFASRESVLETAKTFETLGASAYKGAGALILTPKYLEVAGAIVLLEGRHAAIISDILAPLTAAFAADDVVDAKGLEVSNPPATVLSVAGPFVRTRGPDDRPSNAIRRGASRGRTQKGARGRIAAQRVRQAFDEG